MMGGRRLGWTSTAAVAAAAGGSTAPLPWSMATLPAAPSVRFNTRHFHGSADVGNGIVDRLDRCRASHSLPGGDLKLLSGSSRRHCAMFPSSLMRVRGGGAEDSPISPHSDDGVDYSDDGVSAEELLDSIFAVGDGPSSRPAPVPAPRRPKPTSAADRRYSSRRSEPRPSSPSAKIAKKSKAAKSDRADADRKAKEKAAGANSSRLNKKAKEDFIELDAGHAKPRRGGISPGGFQDAMSAARPRSNSLVNQIRSMESEIRGAVGGIRTNKFKPGLDEKHMTGNSEGRWRDETLERSSDRHRQQTADISSAPPPPDSDCPGDDENNVHAVWGPNAQRRKKPPGPPPARATSDEIRVHDHHQRIGDERKRLLSDLALTLHDSHVSAVQSLIRGSAAHVPPSLFGQTIMMERAACNEKFRGVLEDERNRREGRRKAELFESTLASGRQQDDSVDEDSDAMDAEPSFRHIEDPSLLSYWGLTPDARLYGGAQYHRVLRYYHHLFLTVPLPPTTDDEVAILTDGISDIHDASDLLRAVALLVRRKMEAVAEDVLADMTRRLLYVMDRQWEMVDYSMALHRPMGGSCNGLGKSGDRAAREAELFQRHGADYTAAEADLKGALAAGYHKFAEERAAEAHGRSLEDVRTLLRYVAWDVGVAKDRGQRERGVVSQIEIVKGESAESEDDRSAQLNDGKAQDGSRSGRKPNAPKRKKKADKKSAMPGHPNSRMVARGGADVGGPGRSKRASKRGSRPHSEVTEDEMGDLIGGVMNRGMLDAEDHGGAGDPPHALVASSNTQPVFSRDEEVLNVLLDTVTSALVPKSDCRAGLHTRLAIEGLVSHVTDRTRMDLSRIVRSKFNAFFLLAFYEDLGPYLRRELDEYLATQRLDT